MFRCGDYQSFVTVGEDDPAGDEKAFALTRQSRLIPIVAMQSISSLRAVLGQSEVWRALLESLRTRIFLSLADDASAQIASASLLSGSPGAGTGSLSASKSSTERREPLFRPRDFTQLGNFQAIGLPYDGKRVEDGRRCYLKPDFLTQDRPYWRARQAGDL